MRRWYIKEAPSALQINEIAELLRDGRIVLLPADTIYGLHGVATDPAAVERIVDLKGREETKPFIVLASSIDQLIELGIEAEVDLLRRLDDIWPAPLTAILPLRQPIAASRGASTLAVRIPALDWLRDLISRTGPLVSTSANRSGEPPVQTPSALAPALQEALDAVIDGGPRSGEPSAILDLSGNEPRFIREGEKSFTQNVWKTLRKSL
jgi:tRNA threonylcarbamoyl adenosine modification protein (Sua5/YciO/YrdC/YwlC family)